MTNDNSRTDRDRRVRQADRLGRILNVLRLIQGRGKWNAKAIAAELEVTERTVYRDLQALEFAGVPWFYDAEEQTYRVRADYRFFRSLPACRKERPVKPCGCSQRVTGSVAPVTKRPFHS